MGLRIIIKEDHMEYYLRNKSSKIYYNEIIYIESAGNYVKIFTSVKTNIFPIPSYKLEEKLPEYSFIRIHKSYIVNLSKVVAVNGNSVQVCNLKLPIGKTFKKYVLHTWKKYQILSDKNE